MGTLRSFLTGGCQPEGGNPNEMWMQAHVKRQARPPPLLPDPARQFAWRLLCVFALAASVLAADRTFAATDTDTAPAATTEAGLPFIHNFEPAEYGGSSQNWSITQGPDGVIYVGNVEDGVLMFDGTRWQRIAIPNRIVVRSLATAPNGRVYVGTVGDFGYLQPDRDGQMAYVSLLDKVPAEARSFSDVWSINITNEGIYFATLTEVFRLQGDKITVIKPETSFHLSFVVNGAMYIREVDRGLMRVVGDQLELTPGGEFFADKRVYVLLPWRGEDSQPNELLAGTREHGWFRFDGTRWKPWQTSADKVLNEAAIYRATWLADGRLAVATLHGGVFLLNGNGDVLRRLTRTTGLLTNAIYEVFQDRQHGLWLACDQGITRVDVDLPFTHFGERSGLQGSVLAITRHQGALFVGTTEGLFKLEAGPGGNAAFVQIRGVPGQNWSFASVDGQLLVAGNEGVFSVQHDGTARLVVDAPRTQHVVAAQSLLRSSWDPSRVFVGYADGLGALRWSGDHWIDEGRIAGAQEEVRTLAQDSDGRLWVGLWTGGIGRLTFPAGWKGPTDSRAVTLDRFGSKAGLPSGQQAVVATSGRVRVLTNSGVYRYDASSKRFVPDADFENLFPGGPRQVTAMYQDRRGEVWMYTYNGRDGIRETGRAQKITGRWQWHVTPLQPISGSAMSAFYDDPDGVVWLGGDKGLFRYDPAHRATGDAQFNALIRGVTARDGRTLFANEPRTSVVDIPYAQNALRFEFSAPSFDFFDANSFQVLLQGVDPGWSPWSGSAFRDYTNIHEGNYRFRVRARNVYGEEGIEATFSFRVLPPWYRTWWAWTVWLVSGVLALTLLLFWRSTTLRRRNSELAALVDQRTTELARANQALQETNQALSERSVTDPLTGLKNRRYLYDHVEQDLAMSRRHCEDRRRFGELPLNTNMLFLMLDIDHFKEINDTYGHAAGDCVLEQVRDVLHACIRDSDTPIRWGGEEFLVVARFALPDAGPQFAERIRAAVAVHRFDLGDGRFLHRTCSVGFATYPAYNDTPDLFSWEQIVNMADECMYAAKRHGRNAWAGVMPMVSPPQGDLLEALRSTLANAPEPGLLPAATSWAHATTAKP